MTSKSFRIRFSRHFELLWPSLVINGLTVLIYVYIIGVNAPLYITLSFFGFFFTVNLLPVLILHTQYSIENYGVELTIEKETGQLIYQKRDMLLHANVSDIVEFSYHSSYGQGSWYTFGDYDYCKIVFSNKREIFITSLMMRNVKQNLEDLLCLKAEVRLKFLALLPFK